MRRTCMKILVCALAALAFALLAGCENIVSRTPRKPVENGQAGNKGGALTVTVRFAGGSARYAAPSPSVSDFTYAALFYKDGDSPTNPSQEDFAKGETADGNIIQFLFQRPDETSGFTLEIFAFKAGATAFSRESAVLSGKKEGLSVAGDAIEVDAIALVMNESSAEQGMVSLKVKVPSGCTLEISDTRFTVTGTSPNFTVTQKDANGIEKGMYQLVFTVSGAVACTFSEYINVSPGLCTDTWDGMSKGEAKEVTQASLSKTIYVRGTGGWYDGSPYTADDDNNSGSLLSPFKTIQKAVDEVIKRNDGTSAYTICVDGMLKCATSPTNGMADFTKLAQNLNLTIKGISANATLDADGNSRVIYAKPASGKLALTLENLTVTGGNFSGDGGGIYFYSSSGSLTISGGTTISGNKANTRRGGGVCVYYGTFTMTGGTISGNEATTYGGGVCACYTTKFTMTGGTIGENTAGSLGGGVFNAGTFTMEGGTISGNEATTSGGGVYNNSTFTMNGGEISGNTATKGGGVFVYNTGTFEMSGEAKVSGNTPNDIYEEP